MWHGSTRSYNKNVDHHQRFWTCHCCKEWRITDTNSLMLHMTVVELKPLMGAWIFSSAFEKGLFSIHTIYSTFEMAEKGTWHKKPQFGIYALNVCIFLLLIILFLLIMRLLRRVFGTRNHNWGTWSLSCALWPTLHCRVLPTCCS